MHTHTHASTHTSKRLQPKTQPKTKQKLNEYRANFAKCTVYEISPHKQARTIRLHITRDYWRQLWRKKNMETQIPMNSKLYLFSIHSPQKCFKLICLLNDVFFSVVVLSVGIIQIHGKAIVLLNKTGHSVAKKSILSINRAHSFLVFKWVPFLK